MPYPPHVPAHAEPSPATYHVHCPACGSWVGGAVAHAIGLGVWAVACPRCGSGAPGRFTPEIVLPFGQYSGRAVSSLTTREGRDYLEFLLHSLASGPGQGLRLAILFHLGWLSAERARVVAGPDMSRLRADWSAFQRQQARADNDPRGQETEKATAESRAQRHASWLRHFEAAMERQRGGRPRPAQQFHEYKRPTEPLPPPPVAAVENGPLPAWASVLGVDWPANGYQIRRAYLRQSKRHHPDVGGSDSGMQKINEAYAAAEAWLGRAAD